MTIHWLKKLLLPHGPAKEYPIITLSILVVASLGVVGCGSEANREVEPRWPANNKALDSKVQALEQGMSVEAVRSSLGNPDGERSVDSEPEVQMLFYGRWQLLFENDMLDRRIKYVYQRPLPDPRVVDRREKTFDKRVFNLKRGLSISAIMSMLGPPDTYEIVQNKPRRKEILAYELWELTFIDGALKFKSKR